MLVQQLQEKGGKNEWHSSIVFLAKTSLGICVNDGYSESEQVTQSSLRPPGPNLSSLSHVLIQSDQEKKANKQTNTQKRFDASFLALKQSKRNTLRNREIVSYYYQ